jgi:hypothetical protein
MPFFFHFMPVNQPRDNRNKRGSAGSVILKIAVVEAKGVC